MGRLLIPRREFIKQAPLVAAGAGLMLPRLAKAQLYAAPMISPGSEYVGPGDIVSGATLFWGFRAYNRAYALALGKAIRVIRASDSAELDIDVTATGILDAATLATFLNSTTGKVKTFYDQSGNSNDVTQGTDGARAAIGTMGGNSYYCAAPAGAAQYSATIGAVSQPFTMSVVAQRTGSYNALQQICGSSSTAPGLRYGTSPSSGSGNNNIVQYTDASGSPTQAITDGTAYSIAVNSGAGTNGAGFFINGGSESIFTATSNEGTNFSLFSMSGSPFYMVGNLGEAGLWPVGFSQGNHQDVAANQLAFWNI